ncbi:AAA family ATPase [Candidatus Riflebacteria bacterium]
MKLNLENITWSDYLEKFNLTTQEEKDFKDVLPIIGQKKAIQAIEHGLKMDACGFNIFVSGSCGVGKRTLLNYVCRNFLENSSNPEKEEYCYSFNFQQTSEPLLFILKTGQGKLFKQEVEKLFPSILSRLPGILSDERFRLRLESYQSKLLNAENTVRTSMEEELKKEGFEIIQKSEKSPMVLAEIKEDSEKIFLEDIQQALLEEKMTKYEAQREFKKFSNCQNILENGQQKILSIKIEFEKKKEFLFAEAIELAARDPFFRLCDQFPEKQFIDFFKSVKVNIIERLQALDLEKDLGNVALPACYKINFLGDFNLPENSFFIEDTPCEKNIFGTVEHPRSKILNPEEAFLGVIPGSLTKANQGIYVLFARDFIENPQLWRRFLQALKHRKISTRIPDSGESLAPHIRPQPIPLKSKIILVGSEKDYQNFYPDEEFARNFKIKAELSDDIEIDKEVVAQFYALLKRVATEEGLGNLDDGAINMLLTYSSRLCESRKRLDARFSLVLDRLREGAQISSDGKITEADIEQAILKNEQRTSVLKNYYFNSAQDNFFCFNLSGMAIGEINAMTNIESPQESFGFPTRITANISLGSEGFLNIEREVELSGPSHAKASLILESFILSQFAQDCALPLNIFTCFEQTYSEVDGDSATLSECLAILSAMGKFPLKQNIAVTGSMTQKGEIQSVGEINGKIEGFFSLLKQRGVTDGGVIIPESNVQNLVLSKEVLNAVGNGEFSLYQLKDIFGAIEIMSELQWDEVKQKIIEVWQNYSKKANAEMPENKR